MNLYLLEVFGKWINFMVISSFVVLGFLPIEEISIEIPNENVYKSFQVAYDIQPYETEKVYNNSIPQGNEIVKSAGQEEVTVIFGDRSALLQEGKNEIIYVGTGAKGTYYGNLTGYGADCRGCNGKGNLKCWSAGHNLVEDGKYYNDELFGKVRIVAAPPQTLANGRSFSCGTIVEISFEDNKFLAIVLDRGGKLTSDFNRGIILFDLAFVSEEEELSEIYSITRQDGSVRYEVKRWGF